MSDSLRDQLKQAGFTETKPTQRKKNSHSKAQNSSRSPAHNNQGNKTNNAASKAKQVAAEKASAIAARKSQKLAITELINEHQVKKFAGDCVYSYTLEKKIRQLFVSDDARVKLISGEWVITRLNGTTYLVPEPTGKSILEINPQWLVVSSQDDSGKGDEYDEHPVPDDLQW